jgi:hypothetical protein
MEVIACGGLGYRGAALGLGPLHRSLGVVSSGPGTASALAGICHTFFSKENQVQTYMHARINFHAYS